MVLGDMDSIPGQGRFHMLWGLVAQHVGLSSNFFLLHGAVQFSQHNLLKRLSLPYCIFLPTLSKNKVAIGAWVYFWTFYLDPLVCISIFVQYHTVLMTAAL